MKVGDFWYQAGTSTWFCYVYEDTGRKHKKTLGKGKENEEQVKQCWEQLVMKHGSQGQKKDSMLSAVVKSYLSWKEDEVSEEVVNATRSKLGKMVIFISDRPMHLVKSYQIEDFLKIWKDDSPATKKLVQAQISSFFKWAKNREYLEINPMPEYKKYQIGR